MIMTIPILFLPFLSHTLARQNKLNLMKPIPLSDSLCGFLLVFYILIEKRDDQMILKMG